MLTVLFASLTMFNLKLHFFLNLIIISSFITALTCLGDILVSNGSYDCTNMSASVGIHDSYQPTGYMVLKDYKADISSTSPSSFALMKVYCSKCKMSTL